MGFPDRGLARASRARLVLLLSLWSAGAAANGAAVAALTPGRGGRNEIHVELRAAALAGAVVADPRPAQFRVLLRAGQGRVEQASRLPVAEGVHTVLAFDQSASFRPYLNEALALAQKFLSASPSSGTFTVFSFGTTLGDPHDASSPAEAQRLLSEVARSKPQYQTRLKASILEAVSSVSQKLPMPRGSRQVVVFSDAGEESSVYSAERVIAEARARGVRVHTIILGKGSGATLAQRLDDMRRLAEDTGGYNVEVRDRTSASSAIEAIARSPENLVRLSVSYCGVPASPALRDDQLSVEIVQGGSVAASTGWAPFQQQAGGPASASCDGPAPAPSASAAPAPVPAPPRDAPEPASMLPRLAAGGGALALLAVVLAVVLRGRRAPAPAPQPPPPPAPPLPAPPPAPQPWVNPRATGGRVPLAERGPWLVVVRSPSASGQALMLDKSPFWVGAAEGCDLKLDVGEISSRHAQIEIGPGGLIFVIDNGSTNGTFLDGQRLERGQRMPWKPGQVVGFSTKVDVRLEER